MQKIEIGKHTVSIFSSVQTLPIKRFQKFNKFLMLDNEVGSTFEDYDKRTLKTIELLKKDLKEEAVIELENRRQMVFNSYNEYSPSSFAFAVLVHSIDNEVFTNFSDDGLREIIDKLDSIGFSKAMLDKETSEVKKN